LHLMSDANCKFELQLMILIPQRPLIFALYFFFFLFF
jgi:hypothetical protein